MYRRQWKPTSSALFAALALGLFEPQSHANATASAVPDGQHDFDFIIGRWKVHLRRKAEGSDVWTESDGFGVYRKVWGGRANLNEFFTNSPSGHVEGLTLRTYNPETRQWSLYDDRSILIEYDWSALHSNSPHFEQSFSNDGGKSWEVNWITDQSRRK